MTATEPIRNKQQVQRLAAYYLERGQLRNHLLIVMTLHTALRISDILSLSWSDVYDFDHNRIRESITLREKKTGKIKIVALHRSIITALGRSIGNARRGAPLIENPRTGKAISHVQAYRIIRAAAEAVEIANRVSCHSLRKTFGYHAWKSGVSPAVIMEIYNHSSLAVTRRYLGVTQDDKNSVYLGLDLTA